MISKYFFLFNLKNFFSKNVLLLILFVNALTFSQRNMKNLKNWQFINSDPGGAHLKNFDDSRWRSLTIPHDWAIERDFDINNDAQIITVSEDKDTKPRLRTGRTGALPSAGIGWYRTSFNINDISKKYQLYFDGAMSNAKVYVNGNYIGERPYGYSPFYFDISTFIEKGNNKIAVRLENFESQSRWYTGGGLYREVSLIQTDSNHVSTWGGQITTPKMSKKKASINITTNLVGNGKVTVIQKIKDVTGKILLKHSKKIKLYESKNLKQIIILEKPILWSPKTPVLYQLETIVKQGEKILDTLITAFGIRSIAFKKDGFYLNNQKIKFKGVNLHHDLGPLGSAFYPNAFERQIKKLKKMGVNAIRFSHNPPAKKAMEICDKHGVFTIVEAFDEWQVGKTTKGYNLYFNDWAERDIKNLVKRDFNHPSIIMWSIGNEVKEQGTLSGFKVGQLLSKYVKEIDETRPTTAGFNNVKGVLSNKLFDAVEIVGWNYKSHLYQKLHQDYPKMKMYAAESSSAASSRGIYKFPVVLNKFKKYNDLTKSAYATESVVWGTLPDKDFDMIEANSFVYGEFVWTGYDYLGEPSPYNEEWPTRSSYFGIIDLAGIPKDRYYLYQSHWSEDENVLHVLPHWSWKGREGKKTPIMCYTNYHKVELFVNGKSMGAQIKKDYDNSLDNILDYNQWRSNVSWELLQKYRIIWDDVIFQQGEIKVVAYNKKNIKVAEKITKTAGKPYAIKLTPEEKKIKIGDIGFIRVEVIDKNGVICPKATNKLQINVTGAGIYKASGNGDPTNLESFHKPERSLFSGAATIYIEGQKSGEISISVKSEGLLMSKIIMECEII